MPKSPKAQSPNGVLPKLKAFYDFMLQNNLETMELDEGGLHLRMVRRRSAAPVAVPVPVPALGAPPGGAPAGLPAPSPSETPPAGSVMVKASMMGIFYRAPSPSSPPFVKEGDAVKTGALLCMIEAMKVFNEINADFACTILKVFVENGKPVKPGQDLFLVQRA